MNKMFELCLAFLTAFVIGQIDTSAGGGAGPAQQLITKHIISAASNNAAVIKGSAGAVFGYDIYNNSDKVDPAHIGSPLFVKLYDKATPPDLTVDVPKRTIGVEVGQRAELSFPLGLAFINGISIAIVKGIADDDDTPVAIDDCVADIEFV